VPTILSHPAVPLALGIGLGRGKISGPLLVAGAVASILPDLDVLAFYWAIPPPSAFGHRGFTHSPAFAAVLALLGACAFRRLRTTPLRAFIFLFVATASHGVLDALTNGGPGVAFLWPWSNERFFAPLRAIEVSPIGIARFLSARGVDVLLSELLWIWLPCAAVAGMLVAQRRGGAHR
jgi:inner membrane protein